MLRLFLHCGGGGPRTGRSALFCVGMVLLGVWASRAPANPALEIPPPLQAKLARLAGDGGIAIGASDDPLFLLNPGPFVPASIIKLATALAALEILGPDYRFRTEVYRDQHNNLIVRGYGDPFLISEEWRLIAAELREGGHFAENLGDLVLDVSAFPGETAVDGRTDSLNPYDARLGALISNFNTLNIEIAADGTIRSAESQTPLTPLARTLARGLPKGAQRINLSRTPGNGLRYTGELARSLFAEAGARFSGGIRAGGLPPKARPLLVHWSSRPLREVLQAMMRFSNNFIANQIVMVLHLESGAKQARLDKGVALVARFLTERVGIGPDTFHLVEGSGLARDNRIELTAMLRIVEAFRPWRGLLRKYGPPSYQVSAKTGTLTGISSLAGYFPTGNGGELPFVIMLNKPRNVRGQIFKALASHFAQFPE